MHPTNIALGVASVKDRMVADMVAHGGLFDD